MYIRSLALLFVAISPLRTFAGVDPLFAASYPGIEIPTAICTSGSTVYVAGDGMIRRFQESSSTWTDLPNSTHDGVVHALLVDGSDIYVAGEFSAVGSTSLPANSIARYRLSTGQWFILPGSGGNGVQMSNGGFATTGKVKAMKLDYTYTTATGYVKHLYVGGHFNLAGGISAVNIADYSNSSWIALGTGLNSTGGGLWSGAPVAAIETVPYSASVNVTALNVYAAGDFDQLIGTGTNRAYCAARWDTYSPGWQRLGHGIQSINFDANCNPIRQPGSYRTWVGSMAKLANNNILVVGNDHFYLGNSTPILTEDNPGLCNDAYDAWGVGQISGGTVSGYLDVDYEGSLYGAGVSAIATLGSTSTQRLLISAGGYANGIDASRDRIKIGASVVGFVLVKSGATWSDTGVSDWISRMASTSTWVYMLGTNPSGSPVVTRWKP